PVQTVRAAKPPRSNRSSRSSQTACCRIKAASATKSSPKAPHPQVVGHQPPSLLAIRPTPRTQSTAAMPARSEANEKIAPPLADHTLGIRLAARQDPSMTRLHETTVRRVVDDRAAVLDQHLCHVQQRVVRLVGEAWVPSQLVARVGAPQGSGVGDRDGG